MLEKETLIYIDGNFYPKSKAMISVFDHGLLYGDGVFEGIRAYSGSIFKAAEHIHRLYRSAKMIMLEILVSKQEMVEIVRETLRRNEMKDAYIRLVVTRGAGDLGLDPRKCPKSTIICIPGTIALHGGNKGNGITAMISWVRRNPVDTTSHEIKSLNYLNSVLAKIEANNAGVDEAICLDKNGFVCEGVGENIFLVRDGELFTPPSCTGALDGITAKAANEIATNLGYTVITKNLTPFELFTPEEAFFTGTAAEILPIKEINKRLINGGKPGKITLEIMEQFEHFVRDPINGVPII